MVEILKEINGPMVLTEFQTNPRRLKSENLLQLLPEEKNCLHMWFDHLCRLANME